MNIDRAIAIASAVALVVMLLLDLWDRHKATNDFERPAVLRFFV
jgi:hypothetical protein